MNDASGPVQLPDLLDRLLAGFEVTQGEDGASRIGVAPWLADLIDAHPVLLAPQADAELARRLGTDADEAAQARIAAARHVLQVCREQGGSGPLRNRGDVAPDGEEASDGLRAALSFLEVAERLEQGFAPGGILRAALSVLRGYVLGAVEDSPGVNWEAAREAALTALSEGLPAIWSLQPSLELASQHVRTGILWAQRRAGERGDNQERAIACYQAALTVYTPEGTPHDWARTQNNLGGAYRERLRGDRTENQERAIACHQAALTIRTPEGTPHDWASTQNNLGNAYQERLRGDRAENQERAIACFQATLTVYTLEGMPHDWAMTQNNLGNAYQERLRGDRAENQERAIACHQAALTVRTPEGTPHDWASTQNNLGNAYQERLRGDRAENQERAIACHQAALTVRTPEGTPHDWAGTQNNLGGAYQERLRGDRAENQERAIACYQAALTVYTSEGTPHDWAMTQNNLGNAYQERLRGDRAENQERAIACYQAALPLLRVSNPPHALGALVSIGAAHRELGVLDPDKRDRDQLAAARKAWRDALALREALLGAGTSAEMRGDAARRSRDLVPRLVLLEVELGEPAAAVATLERGRAIADLAALRNTPPTQDGPVQPGLMRGWEDEVIAAQARLDAALAAAQQASGFFPTRPAGRRETCRPGPAGRSHGAAGDRSGGRRRLPGVTART